MPVALERRFLATEFESRAEGDALTIEGYALKWELKSQNLGGFREKVQQGATTKTIGEADIRGLVNHDSNLILGRNRSGTLDLAEDETGLYYRINADLRQSYVRDLAIAMERGDVNQSSFGFRAIKDDWGIDEDDFPIRTLQEIALFDVSPVTYPAYLSSTSGLGSRALERLSETRGIAVTADNLVSVLKGEMEPEPPADEQRQATTPLYVPPVVDDAFDAAIRARLLGF